ncbi:ABC transporter permease [Mesorhizobium sp.]|uniref:ABC transporter permease n=1 Tax=Mesorhizobium sp. TaxID=1871066 RepID=UPI000FE931B1|nr:ABC transporter permease [Mesorhizobium sp.]RWG07785.1 MAG: ABC transporter permease [Mesorhizobium sp.]RWH02904.1 MAG: ABC transporter permease [Mesorhizobium sp.]TIN47959.1 MAG: ABC transporter permease [Mesorhizobium sp.]TIR95614.1 MAG: ABC transporter permease [Mesorhizobium sp.]TIS04474.1 MAG: ABC transporter permease [Mesorhizobium sp.]
MDATGKVAAMTGPKNGRQRSQLGRRIAMSIVAFWIVIAISAPLLAPYSQGAILSPESFSFAKDASILGTDYMGRDLLSRLIYASRSTLGFALVACLIAFPTGVSLGFIAALSGEGSILDQLLSRVVDILMSFPALIMALVVLGTIGTSNVAVLAIVAVVETTRVYRLARALGLDISVMDFVAVSRARGEGPIWIAAFDLLPNSLGPLAAEFGLRYTYAILLISSLSFLGLGVQPPSADWGIMVQENIQGLVYGSPAALIPAFCIASVTVGINLLVDDLIRRTNIRIPQELSGE